MPTRSRVFGGRATADRLGSADLPNGCVGETWEASYVAEDVALVLEGSLAGRLLRDLTLELVGRDWRGPLFRSCPS